MISLLGVNSDTWLWPGKAENAPDFVPKALILSIGALAIVGPWVVLQFGQSPWVRIRMSSTQQSTGPSK